MGIRCVPSADVPTLCQLEYCFLGTNGGPLCENNQVVGVCSGNCGNACDHSCEACCDEDFPVNHAFQTCETCFDGGGGGTNECRRSSCNNGCPGIPATPCLSAGSGNCCTCRGAGGNYPNCFRSNFPFPPPPPLPPLPPPPT